MIFKYFNSEFYPFLRGLVWLLVWQGVLQAQVRETSLYSSYALGTPAFSGGANLQSFAGAAVAYDHPEEINLMNPASYATLSHIVYDLGVGLNNREFSTRGGFGTETVGYMNNVSFAIPYKKIFSVAFGLKPLYRMGYSVEDVQGASEQKYTYTGLGDISEVYLSGATSFFGNLRLGVSISYAFGTLSKSILREAAGEQYFILKQQRNRMTAGGYTLGVQYDVFSSASEAFALGGAYNGFFGTRYKGVEQLYSLALTGATQSTEIIREFSDAGVAPSKLSLGGRYRMRKAWQFMGAYEWTDYSGLTKGFLDEKNAYNYGGNHRFSTGVRLTPDVDNLRNYMDRISYSTGFFYDKKYLSIAGSALRSYGWTFGFSFPVSTQFSLSRIHIASQVGRLEPEDKTLPEEYTISFSLNLSLLDTWFAEYKYD